MQKRVVKYLLLTIGVFLSAIGSYCFAVQADIPLTGVYGISTIVYRLFNVPIGFTNLLINIPILIFTYKYLGKKYLVRSAYCIVLYSFVTDCILVNFPAYTGDRLLAAISCAVVMSVGDAIIYMNNSSTGGLDFVSFAIKVKNPQLKLGYINLGLNIFVIVLGGIIFKDVDGLIYGLILNYIASIVVNKMIMGFNKTMLMLIITKHGKNICDIIDEEIDRGSTVISAKGGYMFEDNNVLLCACSPKQVPDAERAIKKIDPDCFIILLESTEIHGNGFNIIKYGNEE